MIKRAAKLSRKSEISVFLIQRLKVTGNEELHKPKIALRGIVLNCRPVSVA